MSKPAYTANNFAKLPKWDQADFIERNDQLTAELTRCLGVLESANITIPTAPEEIGSMDIIERNEALEAYVPQLQVMARIASKGSQGAKAGSVALTKPAAAPAKAATLAAPVKTATASTVAPAPAKTAPAKLTLTERALAAKSLAAKANQNRNHEKH